MEALKEFCFVGLWNYQVVAMSTTKGNVFVGSHLTLAVKITAFKINVAVGSGVVVMKFTVGIRSLRLKIFVINFLDILIKLFVWSLAELCRFLTVL